MASDNIVKEMLKTRWIIIDIVSTTSATQDVLMQVPADPGDEEVRASGLFQLEDGEADEIIFAGSEEHGWHTLHLPTWSQAGEIYTPNNGWKSVRLSPLFHSSTRRIRLNYPQDPVLKGWFERPGGIRVAFVF